MLLAVVLTPCAASADDPSAQAVSILPWSGAYLQLGQEEQRLAAAYSHRVGHARLRLELSAPLNTETRQADLYGAGRLAAPLSGTFYVGYDSSPTFDEVSEEAGLAAGSCQWDCAILGVSNCGRDVLPGLPSDPLAWVARTAQLVGLRSALENLRSSCVGAECVETNPLSDYLRRLNELAIVLLPDGSALGADVAVVRLCGRLGDLAPTAATCRASFATERKHEVLMDLMDVAIARLGRLQNAPDLCIQEARARHLYSVREHHDIVGATGFARSEYDPQTLAGLEVGFSYGRVTAFPQANLGGPSEDYDQYQVSVGLGFTQYVFSQEVAGYWALRGGARVGQRVDAYEAERCRTLDSADPSIRAESCGDVQVARGEPGVAASAYVGLYGGVLFPGMLDGTRPGLELRLQLDELGATNVGRWGVLAYFSPRVDTAPGDNADSLDPLVMRYGIGFEVSHALQARPAMGEEDAISAGDTVDFRVFALAGVSI